jgi:parvulin-like peptidyl-prolyl isomerase
MFYLPYNPDLKPEDKEGMEKIIKQLLQKELLVLDAKNKNVEKKKEYQELYDNAKESMMFNTMKRKLDQEIQLTDEEVQAYYEQKKDSYKTLATIHLQEIFVKTEEEAKDVLKKLKGGANFTKLAKEKTLRNPFKDKGGDLGFVNRNQFPVLFDSTIQRKTGEIVGPIHFQDYTLGEGWAVAKLLEKKESQIQPLDEIKDKVKQMALNEKRQKNYSGWIEAKKKEIKIEIKEDVLEKSVQKDTTKASQG